MGQNINVKITRITEHKTVAAPTGISKITAAVNPDNVLTMPKIIASRNIVFNL
ncbi:MAG: hypothetical protein PHT79_03375 [Syntrophomonadaceae bacterium]|nr:hypothetical protein [Syntrophomonadaceae bacterium]